MTQVPVSDPFGVTRDPVMPELAAALDPAAAEAELGRRLPGLVGEGGRLRLRAVSVRRYKPQRRCLVEYEVELDRPGLSPEVVVLLGKVRGRRHGKSGYRLLRALWAAGFDAGAPDGISVPEPLGTIPAFRMWLQRKVPGQTSGDALAGPGGLWLAGRVAEAAVKIHRCGVPPPAVHTMAHELTVLHGALEEMAATHPALAPRLERLLAGCDRRGASVPAPQPTGVHRDFYPDQVLVEDERLTVVDFDLYCTADPALDPGNFIGHLTELALRTRGDPAALARVEGALLERFVELSGEGARSSACAYADLTLARHVYLSTTFPERRHTTTPLLELCEDRLLGA